MSLADFRTLVDDLVRDRDQVISSGQRDQAIELAVMRYSSDRPRVVVVDQQIQAGPSLDLPAGWQDDFSSILAVEYPIGHAVPRMLELAHVRLYQSPLGLAIQLPGGVAVGQDARLTYTQRHVVDAATDTVPVHHRGPVSALAGSILCGQLANHYATEGEPTLSADAVDHGSKSQTFRSRERDLRTRYLTELGVSERRNVFPGAVVNLQGSDSRGGDRLFHSRRYR